MENIKILKDILEVERQHYHSMGDYSVTTLLNPPRIVHLEKRYGHLVVPTVKSQIAAFMGSGIHDRAEKNLKTMSFFDKKYMCERTISLDVLGRLITGRFDILYDQKELWDIKTAKTWKIVFDPELTEWVQQQNIYRYILAVRGINVESLNILCFYKDWQEGNSLRSSTYPQAPVVAYSLPMWTLEDTENFLRERVQLMVDNEQVEDDDLPECTREERWERFSDGARVKYAVLKSKDSGRAYRVFEHKGEAIACAKDAKGIDISKGYLEIRYAKRTRCEDWCKTADHCHYFRTYMSKLSKNTLNDLIPLKEVV